MGPLTALLTLGLLAAAPASGQLSTPPSAARSDSLREDFQRRLMLALDPGDAQRDSLRDLRRRLQEELDLLRLQVEEGRITPQGGRVRYRQAIDAYRAGRDTVLTAGQLALIDRARRYQRERFLDPGGRAEPLRLVDALNLSRDQRRQWLDLLTRLREETEGLKQGGRTPSESDYQRLRERYRSGFEALLNATQRLELERIEQERRLREERERLELLTLLEEHDTSADSIETGGE